MHHDREAQLPGANDWDGQNDQDWLPNRRSHRQAYNSPAMNDHSEADQVGSSRDTIPEVLVDPDGW